MIILIYVPGWIGKFNGEEAIFRTKCRTINDYGESYFRKKMRNGDFISEYPFGIEKKNNHYYLFTLSKLDKNIIIGNSSFIPISSKIEEIKLKSVVKGHSHIFKELLITSIVDELKEYGFTRPLETRSFLGRKSKGIISDRSNPIVSRSLTWKNTIREFSLCNAEIIRVSIFEEHLGFFLTYHPRYEIFEEDFLLPQYSDIRDELISQWQNLILMSYEKITERIKKINKIILQLPSKIRIIKNVKDSKSITLFGDEIQDPILETNSGTLIDFDDKEDKENRLIDIFLKELKFIEKPEIGIICDRNNKNTKKIIDKITSYFKRLNVNSAHISFDPIKELNEFSINQKKFKKVLYIIDKEIVGYDGRYSIFKDITMKLGIVNKVVHLSTLMNKNDSEFEKILQLNLLGILYRTTKRSIWNLTEDVFDLVITYSETVRLNGYIKIMSFCLYKSKIRKIYGEMEISNKEIYEDEDLLEIKEKINDYLENSLIDKKILVITDFKNNTEHIQSLIKWLKESKAKVIFSEIFTEDEGRIFECKNEIFEKCIIPKSGTFVEIGNGMNYREFLLITSEIDDMIKSNEELCKLNDKDKTRGLPRPLRIIVYSSDYNDVKLSLQYLYWSTFNHPTSFVRPRKPMDLLFVKKNEDFIYKSLLFGLNEWEGVF